jgi:hypothetical protein
MGNGAPTSRMARVKMCLILHQSLHVCERMCFPEPHMELHIIFLWHTCSLKTEYMLVWLKEASGVCSYTRCTMHSYPQHVYHPYPVHLCPIYHTHTDGTHYKTKMAGTLPQVVCLEKVWVLLLQLLPHQGCESGLYLGLILQCLDHVLCMGVCVIQWEGVFWWEGVCPCVGRSTFSTST